MEDDHDMSDEETTTRNISEHHDLIKINYKLMLSDKPQDQLSGTTSLRQLLSVEHRPPIDDVIDAGCIPLFVKFLNDHTNTTLQFEAAWCLTNIASGTTKHSEEVFRSGAVTSFIQLIGSTKDSNVLEQSIWCLGNLSGDSNKFRDTLLTMGCLPPILNVISSKTNQNILRNAVWCVSNLCRGSPPPDYNSVRACLPYLANVLYSKDIDVLTDTCWALSYLSDGSNDKISDIVSLQIVKPLISLLSHNSNTVVIPALRTLGNIVTGDDSQTDEFIKHGGVSALIPLLSHGKKGIRKEAAWSISNITAGPPQHIQQVIDAGIIPILMKMVVSDAFDVATEATWAISNATAGGTVKQIQFLIDNGLFQAFSFATKNQKNEQLVLEGLQNVFKVDAKFIKYFKEEFGDDFTDFANGNENIISELGASFQDLDIE